MSTKKTQKSQNLLSKVLSTFKGNFDLQVLTLLVFEFIILVLYHADEKLQWNPYILLIWTSAILAGLFISYSAIPQSYKDRFIKILHKEKRWLISISVFALLLRIIILDTYPYVALGDELREIGINGLNFITGSNKDYFQLGSYAGYTYIFSIPGIIGYHIFGGSPIAYRLPAALIGVATVLVTYFLGYLWKGRKGGLILSVLLASSTIHLHFSRTEFIIVSSSFISLCILIAGYLSSRNSKMYLLLGLAFGFSMHAYVAVRSVMIAVAISIAFLEVQKALENKNFSEVTKHTLQKAVRIVIGFIVGFGPSMIIPNFLGSSGSGNLIFNDPIFLNTSLQNKLEILVQLYEQSFGVFFYADTTANFHFPGSGSLLDFPLTLFFILGLSALILKKNKMFLEKTFLCLLFIIPLFNQVLVGEPGEEHRILVALPYALAVAMYGIFKAAELSKKYYIHILIVLTVFSSFYSTYNYFILRLSDKDIIQVNQTEYAFEYMARYIAADSDPSKTYIIYSDQSFHVNLLHYKEKLRFNTSGLRVEILDQTQIDVLYPEGIPVNTTLLLYDKLEMFEENIKSEIFYTCPDTRFIPEYKCPPNYTSSSFGIYIAEY
ncbi:glycosyltransferase family 39 protein [Candidatus Dojkabacteria bacterium]|uniref:Glycosyltransferase family 39 protein n=1 Tax=Candidatus Dojkabacteria bacterium TaxID=2099670 RepID=A0A955L565_9BACT|nr:glycosyltransferase family 39 protein [Candidatus Dojkabacteria bacterium]